MQWKNSVGGYRWLIQCPVHYVTLSHRVLLGCCSFFSHQTSLKKDLWGGFKNTSSNLNEIILFLSKDFAKLCDETKLSHSVSIVIKLFYPILWCNMILTCYKMKILQPLIFLFKINFWQHNTAANLLSSRYSVVMRDRKKTHTGIHEFYVKSQHLL